MTAGNVSGLLESLSRQTAPFEMIVVDNGSVGREVTHACTDFEFARAIRLEQNAGFSRAVNIASGEASGDVIVLVNDDAICEPEFLAEIAGAINPGRNVMMAAGVMRDVRAPGSIETAGIEIDRALLAFDYLNGESIAVLDGELAPPIGPSGAAAAYWKEAFVAAGGFDERIFAYWEDVDLALRLTTQGFRCALATGALGTHAHSATLGPGSSRKNYLMGFGRGYVLRKWGALRPQLLPGIVARDAVICAGQLAFDRNAAGIRGRVAGLRAAVDSEPYPSRALACSPKRGVGASFMRRARRRLRVRQ